MAHDGSNLLSAFSTSTDASDQDLSVGGKLSLSLLDDVKPLDAAGLMHSTDLLSADRSSVSFEFKIPTLIDTIASIGHVDSLTVDLSAATSFASLTDGSHGFAASSAPDAVGAPGAAASLQTMANYLTDGFWIDRGASFRYFDMSSGYNNGTLYYNVTGWVGNLATVYGTESDSNGISADRQTMVREAFKLYGAVLGINFVETQSTSSAVDFFFKDNAAGTAYEAEQLYSGSGGRMDYSVINVAAGWQGGSSNIGGYNGYTFQTFLHEIGHALGLGHAGAYNAGSGSPTYANSATWVNDSWQQTMMSYWDQSENTEYSDDSYAQLTSPMAVDWIALNALYSWQGYGTYNAFTGNTIWGYGTNISTITSTAFANLATYAATNAFTIVDGGGIDTIDFSNYNANQVIDLFVSTTGMTHAWLSSVGGLTKNMTIAIGSIIENATGGGGDDTLWGNDYNNVLIGNGGNDVIFSQNGGGDALYGGTGNDGLYSGTGNNYQDGGDGNDILASSSGADQGYGGNGNDYIYSYGGNDYLGGYAGTDTVYGGTGDDTVWGYDGSYINESDVLYGGDGNDWVYVGTGAETVDGGAGIDFLYSVSSNSYTFNMATGATNQSGEVFTNFEIAYMGSGDDTVTGGPGDDTIYGGGGNDSLIGSEGGVDVLYGGTGDDTLAGGNYLDTDYGGDGNDLFVVAGTGWIDHVYGGNDIDTLDLTGNFFGGFTVNLAATTYSYTNNPGYGTWTVNGVENVVGSGFDDIITGDDGANMLDGGAGNDTINDGSGNDAVYGGLGDDLVNVGDTSFIGDTWDGGAGTDTLSYVGLTNWGVAGVSFNFVTGEAAYLSYIEHFSNFEIFQDNNGSDLIISDGNGHTFYGNDGDDTMVADPGTQYMYGGNGTDTLDLAAKTVNMSLDMSTGLTNYGGEQYSGFEVVMMGSGNDTVAAGPGDDTVYGGIGDDSLYGALYGGGIDYLYGDAGNDTLAGGGYPDFLFGGTGNDVFKNDGPGFVDNVYGGDGIDTLDLSGNSDGSFIVDLTAGTYKYVNYPFFGPYDVAGVENVTGSVGDDNITGDGNGNNLQGGLGNDTLDGGGSTDSLYGGDGNDVLIQNYGGPNEVLDGGAGTDTADWSYSSADWLINLVTGTAKLGSTVFATLAAIENVVGASGNDTITGDNGTNVLNGGAGNDLIRAGGASDTVIGGNGNDTVDGGTGVDSLSGGAGDDWYYVDNSLDVIDETAGNGTADRVLSAVSFALAADDNIEQLSTTLATGTTAISFNGNDLAQTITGNAGVNSFNGMAGNDTIFGLGGNDTLNGGTGDDQLVGGDGNDWFYIDSTLDTVVELVGGGTADRILTSVTFVMSALADIEQLSTTSQAGVTNINLTGNALAQMITGNSGMNALNGLGGADTMYGWDGNDTLNGGTGVDVMVGGNGDDWFYVDDALDTVIDQVGGGTADRVLSSVTYALSAAANIEILSTAAAGGVTAIDLTGNSIAQTITGNEGANRLSGLGGNDTMNGGGGSDTLNGGTGTDLLVGGLGADTFVFDTALGATNIDTIGGYIVADDMIQLSSAIFTGLAAGALNAAAFASNATGLAERTSDHIIYQSTTGKLFFDVDGLGGAAGQQFATVAANLAGFGAGEFFVV